MHHLYDKLKAIRLLVLDVDGVLTDGRLYFGADGEQLKTFHTLDGHGIKLLQASGVEVAIITGRNSPAVAKRASDLGVRHLYCGREDKHTALTELWQASGSVAAETAVMGDDWPDLLAMNAAAFSATVPNACQELLDRADWCAQRRGGEGAVRELCELIMKAQQTYDAALAPYLVGHHDHAVESPHE